MLALLAVTLLLIGLFRPYYSEFPPDDPQELYLYLTVVSLLVLFASAYAVLPRMSRLIGLGLLLGTTAASIWALVYMASELSVEQFREDMNFEMEFWLQLVGHLVLVVAACVGCLALRRYPAARLAPRLPKNALDWVVLTTVGVHAVTLSVITYAHSPYHTYRIPYFVMFGVTAVLASVIPACMASRRFGLSLLVGWIMGSLAVFSTNSHYLIITGILEFSLLALLVAALVLSQTEIRSRAPWVS